ncbi:MAG: sigma-E factor negative regulatory protein [Neisseriaceae bacterium]|nr:sigma-E factor negative regulatory protein [Neisseriaceae bacterium]
MDKRNEQISALMDDEPNLDEQQQAIDFLTQDKNARRVWAEYHIIRDCLQHSAEVAPRPASKIRQWLNKLPANDSRFSAAIAASSAVAVFLGILLWGGGSSSQQPNHNTVENTPATLENSALVSVSADSDNILAQTIDRSEFYQQSYRQSVDMDGLKQVSYSFE